MEIVMFIVGAIFGAIGIFLIIDDRNFRQIAVRKQGRIVGFKREESHSRKSGRQVYYYPVVEYSLPNGQTHRFRASVGSGTIDERLSETIPILLDPMNPTSARMDSKISRNLGIVFALVGIGCCIGFFFIFNPSMINIGIAVVVIAVAAIKLSGVVSKIKATMRAEGKGISLQELLQEAKRSGKSSNAEDLSDANIITGIALQQEITKHYKALKWMAPIFLIIGIGVTGLGAYLFQERLTFMNVAEHAPGTIIRMEQRTSTSDSGTSYTYYPVVDYTPRGATRKVTFTHDMGSSHPSWSVGQNITVLYDPHQPSEAIIEDGIFNYFGAGIATLIGVIFTLASISMIVKYRKHRGRS